MLESKRWRLAIKLAAIPVILAGAAALSHAIVPPRYQSLCDLVLFSLLAMDIAALMPRRWMQLPLIALYSLSLGLAAVETLSLIQSPPARTSSVQTPGGLFADNPVLGWAADRPGPVREIKTDLATGHTIFDATYTIDADGLRRTVSPADRPTVAFFGDSWVFGEGVADAAAMPQVFADLSEGRWRVLNFGFPGYGPEQFLRAVETGIDDRLLGPDLKYAVFTTFADQIRRTDCSASYVIRAPRYALDAAGQATFAGPCYGGAARAAMEVVTNTAIYKRYVEPYRAIIRRDDVALYVATILRAAALVKEKYGAATVVIYDRVKESDYFAAAGVTDDEIMARLRRGGVLVLDMSIAGRLPQGVDAIIEGDGHPSAAAQRARAEVLTDYLAKVDQTAAGRP
ncbi:MAG: SGNH/GDSL hydrolase family protein [Proteobacteria bacterium]|nr:SGNH/GDSL hydrolase family protein [Pseudomonadota bacterium]